MKPRERLIFGAGLVYCLFLLSMLAWPLLAFSSWYIRRIPVRRLPVTALFPDNQRKFYDWLAGFLRQWLSTAVVGTLVLFLIEIVSGAGLYFLFTSLNIPISSSPNAVTLLFYGTGVTTTLYGFYDTKLRRWDALFWEAEPVVKVLTGPEYEKMSKDDKDRVKRHIVDSSVGINNARIIVSGGKIHIPTPAVGDLARFGGAGLLTVQEGYAVVLERGGRRTRIVGTGVHFLNIFERVDLVVPLVLCTDAIEVENIITQGRIIIGKIKLIVFSRVDAGNRSHTNGEFSFEDKIVNDLIWHPRDSAEVYSWSLTIKKYAEIALRDLAAGLALDDLVLASGKTRDKLRSNLITAINRVTKDKLGIVVTNVEIGEIVLPKERERAPDRMHVEIPIPAQLTIDRYLEDVQDTMLAIDSIYSIIGLVSAGDREVIAHFVAFMREQTNYSAVSNMQLQRFLSAAGIAPLRLVLLCQFDIFRVCWGHDQETTFASSPQHANARTRRVFSPVSGAL